MNLKKTEYQCLYPTGYSTNHKYNTKIIVYCLLVIQLMVLAIWLSTFWKTERMCDTTLSTNNVNVQQILLPIMAEEFIDNSTCTKNKNERFDCHPEPGGDKNNCVQRGCCWDESIGEPGPACFYPTPYNGYKIVNKTEAKMGMQIFLTRIVPSAYPGDVNLVKLDVHYLSSTTIHVKVSEII